MKVYGTLMEGYWQGETEALGGKSFAVPLYLPEIAADRPGNEPGNQHQPREPTYGLETRFEIIFIDISCLVFVSNVFSAYWRPDCSISSYLFTYLHTYLLTYLFTPLSRVLLENLIGSQLVKKFPARFITAFTRARHLSLSEARLIQSMSPPQSTSTLT